MLPKFTIIVPTRDRSDVLEKTLMALSHISYPDFEVIVSDNSSVDDTERVCATFPFVKHIKTEARVSMSHNWEFALSHAKGDWVTIIGDDDGVMPSGLMAVSKVINENPEAQFIRTLTGSYWWPGVGGISGRLVVPGFTGKTYKRNASSYLRLAKAGIVSHTELPMLYNGGYAKLSLLKEMKLKFGGKFYHSAIPDVFSAVAIADHIESYLYLDIPTAINGASKHSTGTSQFTLNKDLGEVNPASKFISESNIPFHHKIPLIPNHGYPPASISFVYESYFQVCDLLKRKILNEDISSLAVISLAQSREPYKPMIKDWVDKYLIKNITQKSIKNRVYIYRLILNFCRVHNFHLKLNRRLNRVTVCLGIEDICKAAQTADDLIPIGK